MQLTIEIPDSLARQLESAQVNLADVIQRGLDEPIPTQCAMAEEIIEFLSRGPDPHEILDFRPSEDSVKRLQLLLAKNRENTLTPEERSEVEGICAWNRIFALIKAQARLNLQA